VRVYRYVGPDEIRAAAVHAAPGTPIHSRAELERWLAVHGADADGDTVPATYVVTEDGVLRIASRRSEHVACAGGQPVLAAGEMFFARDHAVEISNLSTGYCPEPGCWTVVADALDRAGLAHPTRFTTEITFRRCSACGERNVVKDEFFVCAVCDADLPVDWNFQD